VYIPLFEQVATVTWRPCFGEFLQHCIRTALGVGQASELAEILAKCRSIAEHFRLSDDAVKQLVSAQAELSLPQKTLQLDCADRWNSTVNKEIITLSVYFCHFCHDFC